MALIHPFSVPESPQFGTVGHFGNRLPHLNESCFPKLRSVEVNDGTARLTLDSLDYIKWSGPTAMAAMEFAKGEATLPARPSEDKKGAGASISSSNFGVYQK